MDTINDMINPWNDNLTDGIVSLGSGVVATKEIQTDLDNAHWLGEKQAEDFVETRLLNKSEAFNAPLKRNGLKTFEAKKGKSNAIQKALKVDRATFARLVIVAQSRDIDMKTVLSYPLSPVASALASCDGLSIAKTNKSSLLKILEEKSSTITEFVIEDAQQATIIIDAMAVIQAFPLSKMPATFGEFAACLLRSILTTAKHFSAKRIDFVGDQYQEISIKGLERQRRGAKVGNQRAIYSPTQTIPKQWTQFLSSGANKRSLQSFVVNHWESIVLTEEIDIYVAVDQVCKLLRFTTDQPVPVVTIIDKLKSDHEEADTRMLLHAMHAHTSKPGNHIIVQSPDTDVAVIALHCSPKLTDSKLWFATGTGNKKRLLSISTMAEDLGPQLMEALPAIHAFTGCDSVSSFHGKGKKSALSLASEPQHMSTFRQLGEAYTASPDLAKKLEVYVCQLYKSKSTDVNEARYQLFCSNAPQERSLPPNRDCLTQHANRAAYQSKIWKSATQPMINCPSPNNSGWCTTENGLVIKWMDGEYAPAGVLKNSSCSCKQGCSSRLCSCKAANLQCTDLCRCLGCQNTIAAESDKEAEDSDSDDEV